MQEKLLNIFDAFSDLCQPMRVVITAATSMELVPAFSNINKLYTGENEKLHVSFQATGVGMLASAVSLYQLAFQQKPDLIIQAGIAGTFDKKISLGEVVVIDEEMLGDTGVEENGEWKDIFDMNLTKPDDPPYNNNRLPNEWLDKFNLLQLPTATSITVNEVSTNKERMQQLIEKYKPTIESMEGAALHYVCRLTNIPFIQIRSISNYVGIRDKSEWKIKDAIVNLNDALLRYIDELYKMS
jgi:futalosine hydrolase